MQEWFSRVRRLGAGVRSAWGTLPKWQREDFLGLGPGEPKRQYRCRLLRGKGLRSLLSDKKSIK
jgi:hypothetical protein